MSQTNYFVVPAPGYYGDVTKVVSSHRTLAAAKKKAGGGGYVVRVGDKTKGETFYRSAENVYPVAE